MAPSPLDIARANLDDANNHSGEALTETYALTTATIGVGFALLAVADQLAAARKFIQVSDVPEFELTDDQDDTVKIWPTASHDGSDPALGLISIEVNGELVHVPGDELARVVSHIRSEQ